MKKEKIIVKNNDHLNILIKREIQENGNKCNLNHLDVSSITDLSNLFNMSIFEGDISEWDTSNVKNMESMFENSNFNGDISTWNVSKVEKIEYIFENSQFDRYDYLNNWKPFNILENNIFNDEEKNKKVYWSNENINLNNEDIKLSINKYWAEKEKESLINQHNNIELTSKKEKFKI